MGRKASADKKKSFELIETFAFIRGGLMVVTGRDVECLIKDCFTFVRGKNCDLCYYTRRSKCVRYFPLPFIRFPDQHIINLSKNHIMTE